MEVTQKEKHTIYLFDHFEGTAFEHLKSLGSRYVFKIICSYFDFLLEFLFGKKKVVSVVILFCSPNWLKQSPVITHKNEVFTLLCLCKQKITS